MALLPAAWMDDEEDDDDVTVPLTLLCTAAAHLPWISDLDTHVIKYGSNSRNYSFTIEFQIHDWL